MRVSELIYRVQVACGISAKAILVTLQKEQGLTTSSAPSDWNLRAAMGASCPDTEPCDPAYSGVGPQIVQGVRRVSDLIGEITASSTEQRDGISQVNQAVANLDQG